MRIYHLDHIPGRPYSLSAKKANTNIVYIPLQNNILLNTKAYTEILFRTDQFFLADKEGHYEQTVEATAIDFLMHSPTERCMYVARSFVIPEPTVSVELKCVYFPVSKRRRFNVVTTLYRRQQRCYNVKTTPCAYWVSI